MEKLWSLILVRLWWGFLIFLGNEADTLVVDVKAQDILVDKVGDRSSPVLGVEDLESYNLMGKNLPKRPTEPVPIYQEKKSRRRTFDFVRKSLNLHRRPKSVKKEQKLCVIL